MEKGYLNKLNATVFLREIEDKVNKSMQIKTIIPKVKLMKVELEITYSMGRDCL